MKGLLIASLGCINIWGLFIGMELMAIRREIAKLRSDLRTRP